MNVPHGPVAAQARGLVIEIGRHRVPGGWFIPRPWLRPEWLASSAPVQGPRGTAAFSHLFTDDVGRRPWVRDALVEMIRGARQKVFFCSFILADEGIVRELCAASERLRGGVYVLTALGKHMKPDTTELDEEPSQKAAREEQRRALHNELLEAMTRSGVWVRSMEDCHAKFCVVDDEAAVVTSCNATPEAYLRNPENGVLVRDAGLARSLSKLFARTWLGMTSLEMAPSDAINLTERLQRVTVAPWHAERGVGPLRLVATVREDDRSLLSETIALIDSAERELVIASYTAVSLKDHPVGAALRRALERGVRLLLVLRPRTDHEDQRATLGWLFEGIAPEQICVRAHVLTHAKAMIADRRRVLLWTGNLDGKHGYETGVEVGISSSHPELVEAARDYVTDVASRSEFGLALHPTQDDLAWLAKEHYSGEWSIQLPPRLELPPDFIARVTDSLCALYRGREGTSLRVGRDLELRCDVDPMKRTILVKEIRRAAPPSSRASALLTRCVLRVLQQPAAHPVPDRPVPQAPQKNKGRRRR